MAKPEWGSKRTCPECSTRFYDLGKGKPATCISCGHVWTPEPLLKSRHHEARTPKPRGKPEAEVKDTNAENPDSAAAGLQVDTEADDNDKTDPDGQTDDEPAPGADDGDPDLAVITDKKIDSQKN